MTGFPHMPSARPIGFAKFTADCPKCSIEATFRRSYLCAGRLCNLWYLHLIYETQNEDSPVALRQLSDNVPNPS